MICRICEQTMREPAEGDDHHLVRSPHANMCLGCFMAQTQLELFLIRATFESAGGRSVMGDWTAGWLREIIKDPKRYL